jgi:hypothetical protein
MSIFITIRRNIDRVFLIFFMLFLLIAYPLAPTTDFGKFMTSWYTKITGWITVLGAWAIIIGIFALVRNNLKNIYKRAEGWYYDAVTIVSLVIFVVAGFMGGSTGPIMTWLTTNVIQAVSTALLGIEAFLAISAYYRAYRLKNLDAAILLISSLIVLMWMAPVFGYLFPQISDLAVWLLLNPNSAAQRAMFVGIGLGLIALAVRSMLGRERYGA